MATNVVLIVADDLGYGDLGCSGNALVRTPALDELARSGVRLSEHYSGSPVCSPARASLLTGRFPHRTGVIDTREVRGLSRLSTREVTLADRFREMGHATGLIGKWHLGSVGERYAPHRRGFDEFVGFLGGSSNYWDYWLVRNGDFFRGDGAYLTDRLTAEAVDFIHRHRDEPFFLEVAYNAPHSPLQAPDEALEAFEGLGLSKEVQTVYAMISVMDAGIASIRSTLENLGLAEDTIVIFTSDNGPDFSGSPQFDGEPDLRLTRFNAGLRGSKGLVFDGGVRVPALLSWPAAITEPRVVDVPTHFVDWTPTLMEAVALKGPRQMSRVEGPPLDGTSFLPLLLGEPDGPDRGLAWQWNRYEPIARCNAALRRGDWKLVWPALHGSLQALPEDSAADRRLDRPDGGDRDVQPYAAQVERDVESPATPLLFNLARDPSELVDLADEHPDVVSAMVTELDLWFEDVQRDWDRTVAGGFCD